MDMNFTKEEYRILVEMLCLAEWMISTPETTSIININEYLELKNKVLSFCKEMNAEDIIDEDKDINRNFHQKMEFDESLHDKFIEKYDENIFWEELIERLALRDIVHQIGEERYHNMGDSERLALLEEMSDRYATEFERNGIKNIEINFDALVSI